MQLLRSEEPNLTERVNAFTTKHALNSILTSEEVQSLAYEGSYDIPDELDYLRASKQTALQALEQIPINIFDPNQMEQSVRQCQERLAHGVDLSDIPGPSGAMPTATVQEPIPANTNDINVSASATGTIESTNTNAHPDQSSSSALSELQPNQAELSSEEDEPNQLPYVEASEDEGPTNLWRVWL